MSLLRTAMTRPLSIAAVRIGQPHDLFRSILYGLIFRNTPRPSLRVPIAAQTPLPAGVRSSSHVVM